MIGVLDPQPPTKIKITRNTCFPYCQQQLKRTIGYLLKFCLEGKRIARGGFEPLVTAQSRWKQAIGDRTTNSRMSALHSKHYIMARPCYSVYFVKRFLIVYSVHIEI